jgi:hypothetical protein
VTPLQKFLFEVVLACEMLARCSRSSSVSGFISSACCMRVLSTRSSIMPTSRSYSNPMMKEKTIPAYKKKYKFVQPKIDKTQAPKPPRRDLIKNVNNFAKMTQQEGKMLEKFISFAQEGNKNELVRAGFKYDPESKGYYREWIDPEYAKEVEQDKEESDYESDEENIDDVLNDAEDFLLKKQITGRSQPNVKNMNYFGDPYFRTSFQKSTGVPIDTATKNPTTKHDKRPNKQIIERKETKKMSFKELLEKNRNQRANQAKAEELSETVGGFYASEDTNVDLAPKNQEVEDFPIINDEIYKIEGYKRFTIDDEFITAFNVWSKEFGPPLSLAVLLDFTNDSTYVIDQEYENELAGMHELLYYETPQQQQEREKRQEERETIEKRMKNAPMKDIWKEFMKRGLMTAGGEDINATAPLLTYEFGPNANGIISRLRIRPKSNSPKITRTVREAIKMMDEIPKGVNAKMLNEIEKRRMRNGAEREDKEDLQATAERIRDDLTVATMRQIYFGVFGRTDIENIDNLSEHDQLALATYIQSLEKSGTQKDIDKYIDQQVKKILRKKIMKKRRREEHIQVMDEKQQDIELRDLEKYVGKVKPKPEDQQVKIGSHLITPELEKLYEKEKDDFFAKYYSNFAEKGITASHFERGFDEMMPELLDDPAYEELKTAFNKTQIESTKRVVEHDLPTLIDNIQEFTEGLPYSTRVELFKQVASGEMPPEIFDDKKAQEIAATIGMDKKELMEIANNMSGLKQGGEELLAKLLGVKHK